MKNKYIVSQALKQAFLYSIEWKLFGMALIECFNKSWKVK